MLKLIGLFSAALAFGPFTSLLDFLLGGSTELIMDRKKIADIDELDVDSYKTFSYPRPADPERYPGQYLAATLVRLDDGQYRAYNTVCTHLQCIAQYKSEGKSFVEKGEQELECPCHGSIFSSNTGFPIAGPAFMLKLGGLPEIQIEIAEDGIYAIGLVGEIGIGRSWD